MRCPNCEAKIPDRSKFCRKCGAHIELILQARAEAKAKAP